MKPLQCCPWIPVFLTREIVEPEAFDHLGNCFLILHLFLHSSDFYEYLFLIVAGTVEHIDENVSKLGYGCKWIGTHDYEQHILRRRIPGIINGLDEFIRRDQIFKVSAAFLLHNTNFEWLFGQVSRHLKSYARPIIGPLSPITDPNFSFPF